MYMCWSYVQLTRHAGRTLLVDLFHERHVVEFALPPLDAAPRSRQLAAVSRTLEVAEELPANDAAIERAAEPAEHPRARLALVREAVGARALRARATPT